MILGTWGYWAIIAFLGCYAAYRFFFPVIRSFPAVIRVFKGGRFNKKNTLTEEQYKKLSVGSLFAYCQNAYINTLSTGLNKKRRVMFCDYWGVSDKDEAFSRLEDLCEQPFTDYISHARRSLNGHTEEDADEEYTECACRHYANLMDCYDVLVKSKIIGNKMDLDRYGAIGWDAGRLVFMARLCYDAKYISEEEAWEYIDIAYEMVKERYTSWHDLVISFIIGHAMCYGKKFNYELMKFEADTLLSNPEGPWTQMPW